MGMVEGKMVVRLKQFVTALLAGVPVEKMRARYPDFDFTLTETEFRVVRKTPWEGQTAFAEKPTISPEGEQVAETVPLKVDGLSEAEEAKRVAELALAGQPGPSTPIIPVE